MRNGELVRILTTENLGEYMMIQAALKDAASEHLQPRAPQYSGRNG